MCSIGCAFHHVLVLHGRQMQIVLWSDCQVQRKKAKRSKIRHRCCILSQRQGAQNCVSLASEKMVLSETLVRVRNHVPQLTVKSIMTVPYGI